MPSSFSRFLSPQELERVRELYFESLKDEDTPDKLEELEMETKEALASEGEETD